MKTDRWTACIYNVNQKPLGTIPARLVRALGHGLVILPHSVNTCGGAMLKKAVKEECMAGQSHFSSDLLLGHTANSTIKILARTGSLFGIQEETQCDEVEELLKANKLNKRHLGCQTLQTVVISLRFA